MSNPRALEVHRTVGNAATPSSQLCLDGKRIIGIDPGRKNIVFCVELDPESRRIVKKTKLTTKQYYCDSGFTRHKKKTEKWLSEERINEELSGCESFDNYLGVYKNNFQKIWGGARISKKWRRGKFRVYCLKRKTLDSFVNRVVGDTTRPFHVAFGAAKFAATGKGEHYASPSSTVGKLIQEKAGHKNFTAVDEWNTSKVCHRCHEPLTLVGCSTKPRHGEVGNRKFVVLRGLCRCSAQSYKKQRRGVRQHYPKDLPYRRSIHRQG